MKRRFAAILMSCMLAMSAFGGTCLGEEARTFVYGTTGYGESMGDAGLNPHDNYSGWSALRYGVGETLFKYSDSLESEPWLATDYAFIDDATVRIELREGVQFSSGRAMDAQAFKECLEHLVEVHDRPACALSDGVQALTCGQFARLADKARAVRDALE